VCVVDDIAVEFSVSCLSLNSDPFCHDSAAADVHLLLKTVPCKVFAEQLTCKDAVCGRLYVNRCIIWIN